MNFGGVEQFMMNIYRNINKKNFRLIFMCYHNNQYFEKEIKDTGSNIYYVEEPKKIGVLKFIKEVKKIIKEEHVDVVHIHTYHNSIFPLIASKMANVKKRIVHSHSKWVAKNLVRKIYWFLCKIGINMLVTDKLACSNEAGKRLFFGNFQVIPNGIELNKFYYNEEFRNVIRKKYKIKDSDIVLGHVGRLDPVKNHLFMLEVLEKLIKINPSYKMMFVGEGNELDNINKYIKEHCLEENVILVGGVEDAYKYYNAFDLFLLPSIEEGLGIVLIESQVNGLSSLASVNVPREVNESGNIKFLELNTDLWVKEILNSNFSRNDVLEYVKKSKYNINNTVTMLEKIYK